MKASNGGDFKLPLMADNIGGFSNLGIDGKLQLQIVNGSLTPVATPAQTAFSSIASAGPYNNAGIPGIKSYHFNGAGYASLNPYFGRIAQTPTQTVAEYISSPGAWQRIFNQRCRLRLVRLDCNRFRD